MPIILPHRKPIWNKERILISLIIFLSILIVYITFTELKRIQPALMMHDALQQMNGYEILSVQIVEEGNDYALNFKGKLLGDKIVSGALTEYDLDVYLNRYGELFLKDLIDGTWKNAADLELEALNNFFIMPFELLKQNQESFSDAHFLSGNEKEYVIKLRLPAGHFSPYPMPEESWVNCFMFIEEETLFIYKITFLIYENSEHEKFRRTFIFSNAQEQEIKETHGEEGSLTAALKNGSKR